VKKKKGKNCFVIDNTLDYMGPDHFYAVLFYLYSGKMRKNMTIEQCISFVKSGMIYQCEHMINSGVQMFQDLINLENYFKAIELCLRWKVKPLKKIIKKFLLIYQKFLTQTLNTDNKEDMVSQWIASKFQNEVTDNDLKKISERFVFNSKEIWIRDFKTIFDQTERNDFTFKINDDKVFLP